ncbi:CotH kinase family protein, partial [bacterium]|nr:CotH kinase family protein [bacterium]
MKQKLLFFFVCIFVVSVNAQIYINEFLASNNVTIQDNAGEYDDWIELYNAGESPVNLSGYFLTDDLSEPNQWAFPDVSIEAKSFLLIWADKDDEQGPLHAKLKLSSDGEAIGLFDGSNYVDSLSFGPQTTDISMGRFPDADPLWYYFSNPSPAETNPEPVTTEQAAPPTFSHSSGYYSTNFLLELSTDAELAQILYTLDGTEPTAESELYTTAIPIQETTSVRAITVPMNGQPSFPLTKTYFFTAPFDIPVLSLVTAPENLWSESIGIYQNPEMRGDEWERSGSAELIDKNSATIFESNCGIRIHGNSSRQWDKKSLRIYFRKNYGNSPLNCQLFSQKENMDSFKRLVVHSGSIDQNSARYGKSWSLVRDPISYELHRQIGGIYAANRPVAVFLNGDPWGIYNLSERIDDNFAEGNFGETNIDLITHNGTAKEGDSEEWKRLMNFIKYRNLSNPNNYEEVANQIDIENLVNYFCTQIWIANRSYYDNILMYRPRENDAKWKYILWDTDASLKKYNDNTLEWIINFEDKVTLKKLLENRQFKSYFVNRALDLINTTFSTDNATNIINQRANQIRSDITFESDRWSSTPDIWETNIQALKEFAAKRPSKVRKHFADFFDLGREYQLTLEAPTPIHGKIELNTLSLNNFPWTGTYMVNEAITLEAIPDPGYMFVGWSDPTLPQTPKITIKPSNDYSLFPIFAEAVISYPVTINEINYNSHDNFDPGDWIELHNYGAEAIDISDWHFMDSSDSHDFVLPAALSIPANDFLVLAEDLSAFQTQFPTIT